MFDNKTRVLNSVLAAHALQIALPALAVRRIRQHEIELTRGKGIVRKCRVFRSTDKIVGRLPFSLEQEIGLGDRIGLGVDFLTVEVRSDLLAVFFGKLLESF